MNVHTNLVGVGSPKPSLSEFNTVEATTVSGLIGNFSVLQNFAFNTTYFTSTTTVNNYAAGIVVKCITTSGSPTISGIDASTLGSFAHIRWFFNGGTVPLTFLNESSLSTNVNRFYLPNGNSYSLDPDESCVFVYDADINKWVLAAVHKIGVYSESNPPPGIISVASNSSSFTATAFTRYFITGNNVTCTLPTSPADGSSIFFVAGSSTVTGFAVARGGTNTIMGGTANLTQDGIPNFSFGLVYRSATTDWRLING